MENQGNHADDYLTDSVFEDGDESDVESLSPVNGYFSHRSQPSGVSVENSSTSAEAESKAREAAAEQREGNSSAAPHSQLSSPALSAISVPWSEPDIPNLNMNPPDYATATANQPTYGSIQQPVAHDPLATSQQQSMSDAVPLRVDEESGLLTQRHDHKSKRSCRTRWCGPVSTCNTILVVAVVTLVVLLSQAADSGLRDTDGGNFTPHLPKLPDSGDHRDPIQSPYFPPSDCAYQTFSETQYYDFPSPRNFSFVEFMESQHLSGGVEGTLYVQPSVQTNQEVDIRLRIAYATTSPFHVVRSNYIKDGDSFTLELPDLQQSQEASRGPRGQSCLSVFVGVEIRPGVKLGSWAVSAGNLDVVVADGLFNSDSGKGEQPLLQIIGDSVFSGIRGKAEIANWTSRRTIIEFISGTIKGRFALRDLLSLKTMSGNIDVTVDPKEADPGHASPAQFTAVSTSGNIDVKFPTKGELPARDFRTRLETVSSSIRGSYIAGTSTSVHSISGDIHANLLPYYTDAGSVNIHTASRSSKTSLRVLPPYSEGPWPSLAFEHKSTSTSGSIDVVYPQQWEGNIDGQSTSGRISMTGEDVQIINEDNLGPLLKHVVARKGKGSSRLGFKTISGDISVRVGDVFSGFQRARS